MTSTTDWLRVYTASSPGDRSPVRALEQGELIGRGRIEETSGRYLPQFSTGEKSVTEGRIREKVVSCSNYGGLLVRVIFRLYLTVIPVLLLLVLQIGIGHTVVGK